MSPAFRGRGDKERADKAGERAEPLRMVLDDETVERLQTAAAAYGMDVEALMVAVLQAGTERIGDLLGEPPSRRRAN